MSDHPEMLGDAPLQAQYRENMQAVAKALDQVFNADDRGDGRKVGFVLLVFPFGEQSNGRCNFISNGADRKDIVTLFKEMIVRFENQFAVVKGNG